MTVIYDSDLRDGNNPLTQVAGGLWLVGHETVILRLLLINLLSTNYTVSLIVYNKDGCPKSKIP